MKIAHLACLPMVCLQAGVLLAQALNQSAPSPGSTGPEVKLPQEVPLFKAGVRLIEVDAFVTDRDGNFVRGLTPEDFEIIEDGKPQDIRAFSFVDLPLERARGAAAGRRDATVPDITTNAEPARTYVILLDSPSSAAPPSAVRGLTYTTLVKRIARRFLDEAIRPGDQIAVVHTQGTFSDAQGFTTSRQLVLDSIEKYGQGLAGDSPRAGFELVNRTYDTYRAIQDLAERLGAISGRRKAILWIGGQVLFDPAEPEHPDVIRMAAPGLFVAYRDAMSAATRNNVAVYPIDPSGLSTELGEPGTGRSPELLRLAALRVVAEDTGGIAVVNTNNFSAGYDAIVRDNSTYYLLGYSPAVAHRDGRFHGLQVRVKRPGLTVRARKGYFAPAPDGREPDLPPLPAGVSAAVRDALRSPISVNGLSLQLASAPFKSDDQNGSVLVSTQIRGLDLTGNLGDRIAVSFQVFDLEGNVQAGEYKVFALDLAPDARAAVARDGLRFVDRIAVPPGRYEIRLAADQPEGAVGSVVAHFEVPEFRERLALSGLTLASASTAGHKTLLGDDVIPAALAGQPTAVRAFPAGDMLTVFAEVYGDDRISFENLTVTGTVRDDGGEVVARATGTPVGPADGGAPGRWGYRTQVALAGLSPGHYVLTVEARSRRPNRTAQRRIPFEVK